MGRVSQAQAQENRKRIVETAARLFRERGVAGVSVADVMAEVGLTHGGFYKQFASKEALVAEAVGQAFAELSENLQDQDRDDFVRGYLSAAHRDNPGPGCPAAGFAGDLAHERGALTPEQGALASEQGTLTPEQGALASEQGTLTPEQGALASEQGTLTPEQGALASERGPLAHEQRPRVSKQGARAEQVGAAVDAYTKGIALYAAELGSLADVATLVGALILARATAGTELSDRILDEARAKLVSAA